MSSISNLKPILATAGIDKFEGPGTYTGPSPHWLLANHKLAHQTIACHPIPDEQIFDSSELALLARYVEAPEKVQELLKECNMVDNPEKDGQSKAQGGGSLAGYAVATGSLNCEEIELLREWFQTEEMRKELEGVRPTTIK